MVPVHDTAIFCRLITCPFTWLALQPYADTMASDAAGCDGPFQAALLLTLRDARTVPMLLVGEKERRASCQMLLAEVPAEPGRLMSARGVGGHSNTGGAYRGCMRVGMLGACSKGGQATGTDEAFHCPPIVHVAC
jgi:hypothetical protein